MNYTTTTKSTIYCKLFNFFGENSITASTNGQEISNQSFFCDNHETFPKLKKSGFLIQETFKVTRNDQVFEKEE